MRHAAMVAAIRAALSRKVTCPSCHHKQQATAKHRSVKCSRCGAIIKVPSGK